MAKMMAMRKIQDSAISALGHEAMGWIPPPLIGI